MGDLRLMLDGQMRKLVAEKASIEDAILEMYRRSEVLDEVESWNLLGEQDPTP